MQKRFPSDFELDAEAEPVKSSQKQLSASKRVFRDPKSYFISMQSHDTHIPNLLHPIRYYC